VGLLEDVPDNKAGQIVVNTKTIDLVVIKTKRVS
jgi:hypothetical protein